jgi:antitoxin component YwqK of YwqJK toxin-antitoxin module
LAEKKTFKNGAQEGVWLRKWEDGKLRTKGIYVDDQLNGECTYFDEEGKLLAKGVYKRDKKHGSWYYFEENKVERKEDYRYGELESETIYDTEKEK